MEKNYQDVFTIQDVFRPEYRNSLLVTVIMLDIAYMFEHFANLYEQVYSTRSTSVYIGDLLLDNLPIVNLNLVIIEGALFGFLAVGIYLVFFRPRHILFVLKSLALLVAARAIFISLTHVGIYPGQITPGVGIFDGLYTYLNLQTGFFFSGHTALPFLMALIFWNEQRTRNIFLLLSAVFAGAVLLAHVHYSIDVLAAPFIAYGIFTIVKKLFPQDYELATRTVPNPA